MSNKNIYKIMQNMRHLKPFGDDMLRAQVYRIQIVINLFLVVLVSVKDRKALISHRKLHLLIR